MTDDYKESIEMQLIDDINEALGFIESSNLFGLNDQSIISYQEHCYGKDKIARVDYIIYHLSEFGKFLTNSDRVESNSKCDKVINMVTGQRLQFSKGLREVVHRFIRVEFTFHSGLSKDTIVEYVKDNHKEMLNTCHEVMANHSIWKKNGYVDGQYFLNTAIMTTYNTIVFEFVQDRRKV